MTPDEVRRMSVEEVLIFARGQRPIRAPLLEVPRAALLQTAGGNQAARNQRPHDYRAARRRRAGKRTGTAAVPPASQCSKRSRIRRPSLPPERIRLPKVKFLNFAAGSAAAKVQGQ